MLLGCRQPVAFRPEGGATFQTTKRLFRSSRSCVRYQSFGFDNWDKMNCIRSKERHARVQASDSSSSVTRKGGGLEQIAEIGTMMFPIWALISATTAFFFPSTLSWMTTSQFEQGVGLLMLSMGLSLSLDDFKKCAQQPIPILLGFFCQYSILPILAYTISHLMSLPPSLATGMIILGSCPGGQASNVATYVAHGSVSLSVLMTTVSTIAAAVMTPLLSTLLAGQYIPVNGLALAESTAKLVLLPTVAGVILNEMIPKKIDIIRPAMPLVALFLTVVLCAVPVAQVQKVLQLNGSAVIGPVVLLHSMGYLLGYLLPKSLKFSETISRTVSIETGMQSAAMAYALSTKHFADIMVAVPASVSIVIMVWMGAALASIWRTMPPRQGAVSP